MPKAIVAASMATGGLLVAMAPALAGGSWLEPERDRYEPGEIATLSGDIGRGQLGWVDDGPFFAWLRTQPEPPSGRPWPDAGTNPGDIPLGPLRIEPSGRAGYPELRVSISFAVPAGLPPGSYEVVYCNEPCTTGIGDLIGGTVWVGMSRDAPEPAPTTIAPTTTTSSLAPTTSTLAIEVVAQRSDREPRGRAWIAVVLAALIAITTLALVARRAAARRSP